MPSLARQAQLQAKPDWSTPVDVDINIESEKNDILFGLKGLR
jgi:hypothetical protein